MLILSMILEANKFIFYDLILFIISILLLIHAYRKGLFAQIFGVVAMIVSFIAAWFLYAYLAENFTLVHTALFSKGLNQLLWFFIACIACRLFLSLCRFLLKKKDKKMTPLSFMNHMGGLLIGLLEVCIFIQCWFSFCSLPFIENGKTYKENSYIAKGSTLIKEEVKQLWNEKVNHSETH